MTAEHILDAMNELPDHLLVQADAVRKRKPVRWQLLTTAACLVLTVGIAYGFLFAPTEKASDTALKGWDNVLEDGTVITESQTAGGHMATIIAAQQQMLTVRLDSGQEVKVELSRLQQKPEFMPGQRIRIYLEEETISADTPLKPYKITIEEE